MKAIQRHRLPPRWSASALKLLTIVVALVATTGCAVSRWPGVGPERSSLDRWSAGLASDDWETRTAAAVALSYYPRQAAPVLRSTLRGYDVEAIKSVILALTRWEAYELARYVPELVHVMAHGGHGFLFGSCESPDFELRRMASGVLSQAGRPAVRPLVNLLSRSLGGHWPGEEGVFWATDTLGALGPYATDVLPELRILLDSSEDPRAQEGLTRAIRNIEMPRRGADAGLKRSS